MNNIQLGDIVLFRLGMAHVEESIAPAMVLKDHGNDVLTLKVFTTTGDYYYHNCKYNETDKSHWFFPPSVSGAEMGEPQRDTEVVGTATLGEGI